MDPTTVGSRLACMHAGVGLGIGWICSIWRPAHDIQARVQTQTTKYNSHAENIQHIHRRPVFGVDNDCLDTGQSSNFACATNQYWLCCLSVISPKSPAKLKIIKKATFPSLLRYKQTSPSKKPGESNFVVNLILTGGNASAGLPGATSGTWWPS